MTPASVAVRLWAKTVALNAVFYGLSPNSMSEAVRLFVIAVLLIGGFIVTLPLLMLITPLVRSSTRLPYSIPARIGWLTFSLMVLIIIIYSITSLIIKERLFIHDSPMMQLVGTTIAGLLVAVYTTWKSLVELNKKEGRNNKPDIQ